jgi:hypothetical protein
MHSCMKHIVNAINANLLYLNFKKILQRIGHIIQQ